MVRLRMKRMGRRNRASFRICAFDAREEAMEEVSNNWGLMIQWKKRNQKGSIKERERLNTGSAWALNHQKL